MFAILESGIGIKESAKASHTPNWKMQLKKDAEESWKGKAEAWLKEPTTKPEQKDVTYGPRLVDKIQQKVMECENKICCRTFTIGKQTL